MLAPTIERVGLRPEMGYVWLTSSERHAWRYGVWRAGLSITAGLSVPPLPTNPTPLTRRVADMLDSAGGLEVAAVAVVDLPSDRPLQFVPEQGPYLPWEDADARHFACYRTPRQISPDWISEFRFWKVPELRRRDVLDVMRTQGDLYPKVVPRGAPALEGLSAVGIGPAIPNPRRLIARVLELVGGAFERDRHDGLPRAVRVAARGLRMSEDADLAVVLLYALLHSARTPDARENWGIALSLRGSHHWASDEQMELLVHALRHRGQGIVSDDPTIGACWDADRLDSMYFGDRVRRQVLSTPEAQGILRRGERMITMNLGEVLDAYRERLGAWDAVPVVGDDGAVTGWIPAEDFNGAS